MAPTLQQLDALTNFPRPLYGHVASLANRAIDYRHSHPWIQLSYAMQGVIEVRTSTGRFLAPPQRAIWVPAGVAHRVRCSASTQIRSLYIAAESARRPGAGCRVLEVSNLLRELIVRFSELPAEYDEQGPEGRLASVLLDELAAAPEVSLMLPLPKDPRLRLLCTRLQAQPASRATLQQWGTRLGVSEKTLSRLFLKETGMGFRVWRQRMRLFDALPLLERGERVTDVALRCGYHSTSAFIAAFRTELGATPGEFFGPNHAASGASA
jgi:AraC-like DNA-binding protein